MKLDNDSIFLNLLHQNNAIPTLCQNVKAEFFYSPNKYVESNLFFKSQAADIKVTDYHDVNLDYFSNANWEKSLSYSNYIFSNSKINTEIFKTSDFGVIHPILFEYNLKNETNSLQISNLLLISLLIIFSIFAWVKTTYLKYYLQFLRSLFTYSESNKLYFDQNALIDRLYSALNLIFIFSGGLFLMLLFNLIDVPLPFKSIIGKLFICISIVSAAFMLRYISTKLAGWIFSQNAAFNEYLHSSFLYYKAAGLLILPIVSVTGFIGIETRLTLLIIGCTIFLLTYLASIFRGTKIMLKKGVLLFYWILYLCTIEFFPLILFYKYLIS
jgi:hypothetical protein